MVCRVQCYRYGGMLYICISSTPLPVIVYHFSNRVVLHVALGVTTGEIADERGSNRHGHPFRASTLSRLLQWAWFFPFLMFYCVWSTRNNMKHPGCQPPRITQLRCVFVCVWQALTNPVLLIASRTSSECSHGGEKAIDTTQKYPHSLWSIHIGGEQTNA